MRHGHVNIPLRLSPAPICRVAAGLPGLPQSPWQTRALHQYGRAAFGRGRSVRVSGLASGSSTVNTAPPSGRFCAQTRPWCAAIISRQMASPRPVPPAPGLVRRDWTNLSKMVSSSSTAIPIPWSATVTIRDCPALQAEVDRAARRRKLDGVAHEVTEHLHHLLRIDGHLGGISGCDTAMVRCRSEVKELNSSATAQGGDGGPSTPTRTSSGPLRAWQDRADC